MALEETMEELMLPDLKLPVTFTSDDGTLNRIFTTQPDKGGEGYVWHVGNDAWKVFTSRDTYDKKLEDVQKAETGRLPMGGNPVFKKGTVRQNNGATSSGFVIISRWLEGRRFFGKIRKQFTAALKEQNISHSRANAQYEKVRAGCVAAHNVHLTDIQGFVDGRNADGPLAFYDIHLANSSGQADDLLADITAWGNLP